MAARWSASFWRWSMAGDWHLVCNEQLSFLPVFCRKSAFSVAGHLLRCCFRAGLTPSRVASVNWSLPTMTNKHSRTVLRAAAFTFAFVATPALAHSGHGESSFMTGLLHPLFGLDHVIAMVAVGLWGAVLGRPALYVLPIVFPLVMVVGGMMGMNGIALPYVEPGIAASAIALGLMVALMARPPLWVASLMVGVFALFHGHAHGAELPTGMGAAPYVLGFIAGTAALHGVGIGLGVLFGSKAGVMVTRAIGALITVAGAAFMTGIA
jgi:urease accessory protein